MKVSPFPALVQEQSQTQITFVSGSGTFAFGSNNILGTIQLSESHCARRTELPEHCERGELHGGCDF